MSQLLAPYNNSMRLGQGFNSYTQQVCLDRAVLPGRPLSDNKPKTDTVLVRGSASSDDGELINTPSDYGGNQQRAIEQGGTTGSEVAQQQPQQQTQKSGTSELKVMSWVKPQIVTYSSRFVDKLSDVTDAMNISGSLSIKTATIGGKANGSYVDSDKFKASDINFHLQVKVTNQIHEAPEYSIFNKINTIKSEQFAEVYGDTFISGWEEGGELNAVISVKVRDKSKIFSIKAGIEAEMTTPSISGKVTADFGMEKSKLSQSTETTISVNWSGGGSIKDPREDWTIESLKKAAAAFPDFVAVTPQRTYAILTKYTSLADFHKKKENFSPLDYESAGIYTRSLLDHYMDYKAMWKDISHATYELKGNRATIEMARPSEETYRLASIQPLPKDEVDADNFKVLQASATTPTTLASITAERVAESQAMVARVGNCVASTKAAAKPIQFPAFSPTFAGLIHARKVCRFEMAKIVNEVDLVAKNPKLSTDTTRDSYFLNPLVFEQLLPIVRSLSPDAAKRRIKDPSAAVLLGYVPTLEEAGSLPPVYILDNPLDAHDLRLQKSIHDCSWKAEDYAIQGFAGPYTARDLSSTAQLTNDLETLDATFRPSKIEVWLSPSNSHIIQGVRTSYAKGESLSHGTCAGGDPSHTWDLASDGSEIIVEVAVREGVDVATKDPVVSSIVLVTSNCNVFDSAVPAVVTPTTTTTTTTTDDNKTKKEGGDQQDKSAAATPKKDGEPAAPKNEEDEQPSTTPQPPPPPTITKIHTWARPEDNGQWSLRGFFSLSAPRGGPDSPATPTTLGVVWSKDTFVPLPAAGISVPIVKRFYGLCRALQENIRKFKALGDSANGSRGGGFYAGFADKFLMGTSVAVPGLSIVSDQDEAKYFNALDSIDVAWTIRSIAFASVPAAGAGAGAGGGGKLAGLRVVYANGREVTHGSFSGGGAREVWTCDVKTDLIVAKLTAGRFVAGGDGYIDTVEFIRADSNGRQAAWPLNVSTLRYLGEGTARVSVDVSEVVEQAPRLGGNSKWSIRGFYGETRGGIITRLGVIWGRG